MKLRKPIFAAKMIAVLLLLLLFAGSSGVIAYQAASAQSSAPQYARTGATALYQVLGGMIPFFDGVNGTISYTVTNVFQNGSMAVTLSGNVSEGNEVPVSNFTNTIIDNVQIPRIFPAIDPLALGRVGGLQFENVTCNFVKNGSTTVPAGTFNTMEYSGQNQNGTTTYYWFDPTTGLVIEMAASGGVFQLQSSNIVQPNSVPTGLASSLPFLETFGLAFGLGALIFVGMWVYYNRRASKNNGSRSSKGPSNTTQKGQKVSSKGSEKV